LVQAWLGQAGIQCIYDAHITSLKRHGDAWQLRDSAGALQAESELVVLANATGSVPLMLEPAQVHLLGQGLAERLRTLHAVHGTVSHAQHATGIPPAHWPSHPWNGHGCFLPDVSLPEGHGWLAGSTFEPDRIPEQAGHRIASLDEQHRANAQRLRELLPTVAADVVPQFDQGSVQHWSATRCVTHDRLPLVGPLEDADASSQATLWIHAGMGARGLTFSALGAELLAARLGGEPWPLEATLARSLDVRRPKRKRG
jgi:tRNA 5-methylaminomethyl-2-thiouridine biosynthesis bifunctional protein